MSMSGLVNRLRRRRKMIHTAFGVLVVVDVNRDRCKVPRSVEGPALLGDDSCVRAEYKPFSK